MPVPGQPGTFGEDYSDLLGAEERRIYLEAGFGARGAPGLRPALLVVDVTYGFTGLRREPIRQSIEEFPNSCGEHAWDAMERIADVLKACRTHEVPVFYTTGSDGGGVIRGSWAWKRTPESLQAAAESELSNKIPTVIAPDPTEIVIPKTKPSAFFGTPLSSYLIGLGVDTVIVTGTTTSGCVRATVIDSFSFNFRTIVVRDAVFDRAITPHRLNLFDMQAKYADVLSAREAISYLAGIGSEGDEARKDSQNGAGAAHAD